MSKKINWLITDQNITVNYEGQTYIVKRSELLANSLIKAIKENNLDEIPNLVSSAKLIENYSKGKFLVRDGQVFIDNVVIPAFLSDKIVKFAREDLPVEPLVKFAANLQKNPSFRAVNELYQFLEKNNHPITKDGNFIAYKRVRKDFKDAYTGTFDNSIGKTVEMPRNQVNEDPNQTCSDGLHLANWYYAHSVYSAGIDSNMLEVEVSPADVVSVPNDYNHSKIRVCKYKVLSVVTQPHDDNVSLRQNNKNLEGEEEFCEYCDELGCLGGCEGPQEDDEYCEICDELNCYGECEDEEQAEDEDTYPFHDEFDK